MFESSRPFLFFDYFRVPYRVAGEAAGPLGVLRAEAGGRLLWLAAEPVGGPPQESRLGAITLFGRILGDVEAEALLRGHGGEWRSGEVVTAPDGERLGSIWRSDDGSVFLPFDPGEVMHSYWSERYRGAGATSPGGRAKRGAMHVYYRVRPVLPRRLQIGLRRAFSRIQVRTPFPRWPAETALHDLYDLLFALAAEVAGSPVPHIAPWPAGRSWALVLTHDVETTLGYEHIHVLRDVERDAGLRSSWNLVPRRYEISDELVRELDAAGFEVGVHGLYHDGRDLESLETLRERLPAIRSYAERWGAVGFRSPATHRDWELMPLLGFDYDSSAPDTDPFEPQGGGCCTWLPFTNGDLVEIPITLPQDHTLFVILRHVDEQAWRAKADLLRARGGMAVLITHPDYMLEPRLVEAYARFLAAYKDDARAWHVLPRDLSAWWRRRAASEIEQDGEGWRVIGPAAGEAAVALAGTGARA